jgi:hypothetical protein
MYREIDKWSKSNILYHYYNKYLSQNIFFCFKHYGLSYYSILLYQSYYKTLFHILCTVFNITINCHLRRLINNNLLYHSNIMIVYYNQCAFYTSNQRSESISLNIDKICVCKCLSVSIPLQIMLGAYLVSCKSVDSLVILEIWLFHTTPRLFPYFMCS